MIKIQVIGHLGKDATVNAVNGKSVINFSVAHSAKFKDAQGNQKEQTTWVTCSYWTDKINVAPYLKKGTQVYVEGEPSVRTWESQNGNGASLECRVISIQLLGSKPEGATTAPAQQQQSTIPVKQKEQAPIQEVADDLPF